MVFSEPMVMTGLINIAQEISSAGAALRKTSGGDNWNATATSLEYIESLQSPCRGFKGKVSDASCRNDRHHVMFGLSSMAGNPQDPQQAKLRENCAFQSISFAAFIDGVNFYIYESGQRMGEFGTVRAGDVIEIKLTAENVPKIEYRKNGGLLYTSTKETPLRLFAKVCAARDDCPQLGDLQWIFEPAPCAEGEVALTGSSGIFLHSNGISKMEYLPCSAFNAMVRSEDAIEDIGSEHAGTSFVISQSKSGYDQDFAVGLTSDPDQGSSFESIDHAARFRGSSLKVYQKGVMQGEVLHHVTAGDRIDMIVALDEESSQPKIQYYANRQLVAETHSEVHFPLYVKVCARSQGALIEDLRWISRRQLQAPRLRHVASLQTQVSELQAEVLALQAQLQAERAARPAGTEDTAQRLAREIAALRAENDELRSIQRSRSRRRHSNSRHYSRERSSSSQGARHETRQSTQHSETSSEDWEQMGSSIAASI